MLNFEDRVLTETERDAMKANAAFFDDLAKKHPDRCANKFCNWPIQAPFQYRLLHVGDVCELCYAMGHALLDRAYWLRFIREDREGGIIA